MDETFFRTIGRSALGLATAAALFTAIPMAANAAVIPLTGVLGGDLSIAGFDQFSVGVSSLDASGAGMPYQASDLYGSATQNLSGNTFKGIYTFSTSSALPTANLDINVNDTGGLGYITSYKLWDATSHTFVTGANGLNETVDLALPTLTLTGGDTYKLLLGFKIGDGTESATYTGNVSAVPLPGSLAIFGTSLIGLAALARRRRSRKTVSTRSRVKGVAMSVGAAGLALGLALPNAAHASFVDYSGLVLLNGGVDLPQGATVNATSMTFGGVVTSNAVLAGVTGAASGSFSGKNVPANSVKVKETNAGTSATAAASWTKLNYEFKLTKPSKVSFTITDMLTGSKATDISGDSFALTGGTYTSESITAPSVANPNTTILTFFGLKANALYDLVVTAANNTISRNISISSTISAVPLPGGLSLFGAGLALLGVIAWKRTKTTD